MRHAAFTTLLATCLLGTSLASQAATSLIGDTISFLRAYPNTTTQYGNAIPDTTVVAGAADVVSWTFGSNATSTTFDPEANSVRFDFLTATTYLTTGATFDGYVVSGIDATIDSLSILGNSTSYSVAALTHDGHSFRIALNGSSGPGSVVIGLQFASAVPEPTSAMLALGGLALLGLRLRRRAPQLAYFTEQP